MKITKTASGKTEIRISKSEWKNIGKKAGWMKTAWDKDYKGESLEYQRELTAPTMESMGPSDPMESGDGPTSFDRWQETSDWKKNSLSSPKTVVFVAPSLTSDEERRRMKASVSTDEYEEISALMERLVSLKMFDVTLAKTVRGFAVILDDDETGKEYRAKEFTTLNEAMETLAHLINY